VRGCELTVVAFESSSLYTLGPSSGLIAVCLMALQPARLCSSMYMFGNGQCFITELLFVFFVLSFIGGEAELFILAIEYYFFID
jgi:hypothetical protein